MPVFAAFLAIAVLHPWIVADVRARLPVRWTRWVLVPTGAAFFAIFVVTAPLSGLAAAAAIFGEPNERIPAKVLALERGGRQSLCGRHATLEVQSAKARFCMSTRYSGPPLREGQAVMVAGRSMSFGFLVESIDVAARP